MFPTNTFTSTDLAVYIPEVWGERINDFFKCALVVAPFFTDRSSELLGGGDVLKTPGLTQMSTNVKQTANAVTLNSPTETSVDLTVDQWYETSFAIEDREAAQVMRSYSIMERYSRNAAYSIARQLESAICALFSGFSTTVGTSTTNITDSDIRAAISTLETNCVDGLYEGEVAFILHPNTFWRQVQNIDRFALAINSPVNDPAAKKPAGYIYGIPVIVTNLVPNVTGSNGRRNVLVHKDAIHWATSPLGAGGSKGAMVGSSGVRVQSNYIPEYLSTLTTADILYGVVENRDNAGVQILTHASVA